jgi:Nif-specific regulatory protein
MLNHQRGGYTLRDLQIMQLIAVFAAMALEHQDTLVTLDDAQERLTLSKAVSNKHLESWVPRSQNQVLQDLFDKLPTFAKTDSSILIEGESGSGKEMIAQLLHSASDRSRMEFVAVNCAAIPETLFEAELFGVAKGAATGTAARKGKLELADSGTLFLDEIGELPLGMQAKLLRVLQERTVSRVGSEGPPRKVNFRLLSATNRDLGESVRAGTFREDLYYRINVVRFRIPSLRERIEDIAGLSESIIRSLGETRKLRPKPLSPATLTLLKSYSWPGNIRQLQNKLESALITSGSRPTLEPTDFSFEEESHSAPAAADPLARLGISTLNLKEGRAEIDRDLIKRALAKCNGNKTEAARLLGLSREGLRLALKR